MAAETLVSELTSEQAALRAKLRCNFPQIEDIFADCLQDAQQHLSPQGVYDYLEGASLVCGIGRGYEPVLNYLQKMPEVAGRLGEESLELVSRTVWRLSRSTNGRAVGDFLQSVAAVTRRLKSYAQFERYIDICMELANRTSGSVHGVQGSTYPSPSLPDFFQQAPFLVGQLSMEGLRSWVEYGILYYGTHPDRQRDYFCLQSADAKAVLQRERRGTLFADHERLLDLYMRSVWDGHEHFVPYSEGWDELRKPLPYFDPLGMRLPDVYEDAKGISGLDRYRALLAHMAAHKRWSTQVIVDNYSPFQRLAIETFEDCRVEYLAMREYPGLRRLWLALHPTPGEADCDPEQESCIRHRLTLFSRAVLDPNHGYKNVQILDFVERFKALLADGPQNTKAVADLAVAFIVRTRQPLDLSAKVYFVNTEISYRDDNRHLWIYIEESDDEDFPEQQSQRREEEKENQGLPPRHYPEWDYKTLTYRPDYVSLYERLHPGGDPMRIDALLSRHEQTAKRLKHILDLLKPQNYVRIRYQEEGSELDLDMAIRSLIDYKAGQTPDPRINMSHRHDGRDIAVLLLLDLSQSLGEIPQGASQTLLELSQEAVALLAWAIDQLGDDLAIAGFSSNSRHEVRYQHIKGFSEAWDDQVKGRLAAMEAGYSTRMGPAIRHAAHYLSKRRSEKKLLLILTDGEPADVDSPDPRSLIEDTKRAVQELEQQGIYSYCVNLDPKADDYVGTIFGTQYSVIDRVERLPLKLPELFVSLTK
jgi:hypothetical protein